MEDLKSVYFGCADANTEAKRQPQKFIEAFFDPHRYLEELIEKERFIICGRKGDGKSAYGAMLGLIKNTSNTKSIQRSLYNFNNGTFEKLKCYDKLGNNPYISFWKCVLMIESMNLIHQYEPNIQDAEYLRIFDSLRRHSLVEADNDISITISRLVESNTTLDLKGFLGHGRKHEYEETLQGAEQIYSAIIKSVKSLYFGDEQFVLVVDGLDDLLNNSEFHAPVITGLIRAAEEINQRLLKETISLKIIVIIRNDILNVCRDPNLSKIIRDSGIKLSWKISDKPNESDLIKLVLKRFNAAWHTQEDFTTIWNKLFPSTIGGRDSLDYMLENIIYRPRDILQFFIEAQKEYVYGRTISEDKFQTILHNYSFEYFVDAMRDEITGFFSDKAVTILPEILSTIGAQYFYLSDFEVECKRHREYNDVDARAMLEKLFEAGYIGQHRPRTLKDYTVFSYRNQMEKFQENDECIIHRGLLRALTL